MFLVNWFQESVMGETLMVLFLVAFIGYLVGSITIKGVELGTAGVLLVALVFGHFLGHDEALVEGLGMFQDLGLICFVTSVGFIAGPKFFRNFKINCEILYSARIYHHCDRCACYFRHHYDRRSSD